MKRLFIVAALAISMLTMLAACVGDSSDEPAASQETTSTNSGTVGSTGIQPPPTESTSGASSRTIASIVDPEGKVQQYLDLMDQLAGALRSSDTTDLSPVALEPITAITNQLEGFSEFFGNLDETGRDYVFGEFGVELRQTAERVIESALIVQERRGDEAISQALASLPAFAIETTNTGAGNPVIEAVLVPADDISTLLTVNDVSGLAGGVGLRTRQLDMKSMAANVDPTQVEHIVSFDSLSFDIADESNGLTLTVIHLDSDGAASDQMELLIEEGPELQHLATEIGDVSGFIDSNEGGIGSMVVFKKGVWVVMFHTAQASGVAPLLDVSGVEILARLVAERL